MTPAARGLPVDRRRDTPGVIAAPPVLFGAALVIGLSLHAIAPLRLAPPARGMLRVAGISLIVIGVLLSAAVVRAFRSAGTNVSPYREATRFVSSGPYRYTRNPDYIGQTLLYGASPSWRTVGGRCSSSRWRSWSSSAGWSGGRSSISRPSSAGNTGTTRLGCHAGSGGVPAPRPAHIAGECTWRRS